MEFFHICLCLIGQETKIGILGISCVKWNRQTFDLWSGKENEFLRSSSLFPNKRNIRASCCEQASEVGILSTSTSVGRIL